MSTGTRLPLAQASVCAQRVVAELAPACTQIIAAGSIRRRAPDVGDIEIVAVPRFENRAVDVGLWETKWAPVSLLGEVLAETPLLERLSGGERYVKLRHRGNDMQVDLFITTPEQFGLILLIRTGPADYSQWLVTEAKRRRHHVAGGWLRAGGRCPAAEGLRQSCACPAIPTPTEESVYAALGLPFVPPEARTA